MANMRWHKVIQSLWYVEALAKHVSTDSLEVVSDLLSQEL